MIREFNIKDLDEINDIGSTIKPNFNNYYDIENLNNANYKKLYILEESNIKGFLLIEDHIDFIDIIAIAVNDYHKGYGSKLIEYLLANYKNKKILLEVRSNNTNAINLYKKYNFNEINRRKNYYGNADAIIMEVSN